MPGEGGGAGGEGGGNLKYSFSKPPNWVAINCARSLYLGACLAAPPPPGMMECWRYSASIYLITDSPPPVLDTVSALLKKIWRKSSEIDHGKKESKETFSKVTGKILTQ